LQADFLQDNPQFDCRRAQDPHLAKCGVEHYGCRGMIGDPHANNIYATDGSRTARHWYTHCLERMYGQLQPSPWRVLTEACCFFFRALISDLYQGYVDVCQATDKAVCMDTKPEGEPFTPRALIVNLSTEDYLDSKDCRYGIASLTPFRDFEGKVPTTGVWFTLIPYARPDLVLRQLGLRIVLVRGRELNHSTTQWTKGSRICVVQTNHEAVRDRAYRKLNRPYPPQALAPNFTTESNKRQIRAAEKGKKGTNSADASSGNTEHT
jgi:hypothetical protein